MITFRTSQDAPVRVKKVGFSVSSSKEIQMQSVTEIKENIIYYRGVPFANGVHDHRMGTCDRRILCGTCNRDVSSCQGHPGHLILPFPMYHACFIDQVLKLLRCVCFACSSPLCSVKFQGSGKHVFLAMYANLKGRKKCSKCQMPQPVYTRTNVIRTDWPSDTQWESEEERIYCEKTFTQRDAYLIMHNITDDDARLLGFKPEKTHPRDLMMTNLHIPPPVVRPAVFQSEGSKSRGQDDLTIKLQDIIRRNNELRASMPLPWNHVSLQIDVDLLEKINRLQFEIFTYMNNTTRGQRQSVQRNGQPTKSILERLKGKEGRIRGNLMGKRVNYSARTVITPDATIAIDHVGVPEKIALQLTVAERVTDFNIKRLQMRVHNGHGVLQGAEKVLTTENCMINLENYNDKMMIKIGYVVFRYLQNEDPVVFNRQPSLHRLGMLCHRTKIMPGLTFRLSLCVANAYNADFDGDEMNLHVPQSPAAISEIMHVMRVNAHIISPQANRPAMAIVQDSLLGCYLISQKDTFMDKARASQLYYRILQPYKAFPAPCLTKPKQLWSGMQLLSCLLPSYFTSDKLNNMDFDAHVDTSYCVILNGVSICGNWKKSVLGTSHGSIIDIMCRDFGKTRTAQFMRDVQLLSNAYLVRRGFSVGINDCVLSNETQELINDKLKRAIRSADDICAEISHGCSSSEEDIAERTIQRILSSILMQAGSLVDTEMCRNNAIRNMVNSGSKGNPLNLSQVAACVGQQSVDGKRITADKGYRTLSMFKSGDQSVFSRGFVSNSYVLGLYPQEYWFHAMGGREGLVDTAVKTAQTGYIQRRQVKSMEDHKMCTDGSIRTVSGKIISFLYGGDGMDACRLERIPFPAIKMSMQELRASVNTTWEYDILLKGIQNLRKCRSDAFAELIDNRILLPFNAERIAQQILYLDLEKAVAPGEFEEALDAYASFIIRVPLAYKAIVVFYLGSRFISEQRLTRRHVDVLFQWILQKIEYAACPVGEMVGPIAAQSIGEPTTQMTLNSFHSAGIGSKNVCLGIPRLTEILALSRAPKSLISTIFLKKPYCFDESIVRLLSDTLPVTKLADIVVECNVSEDCDELSEYSGYFIKLHLDQELMNVRKITPAIVARLVKTQLREHVVLHYSQNYEINWYLNMYICDIDPAANSSIINHCIMSRLLQTLLVSGHSSIKMSEVRSVTTDVENPKTLAIEKQTEYVIDVQGFVIDSLAMFPIVDWKRCITNDIVEISNILGIEAAAALIYSELTAVIESDGAYIDPRHKMMIVDTMCRNEKIIPLNRHGINRCADVGPLLQASFEETADILCDAACFGESDAGEGISQQVMTGRQPRIGTGCCSIALSAECVNLREMYVHKAQARQKLFKSTIRKKQDLCTTSEEIIEYVNSGPMIAQEDEMFAFDSEFAFRPRSPDDD